MQLQVTAAGEKCHPSVQESRDRIEIYCLSFSRLSVSSLSLCDSAHLRMRIDPSPSLARIVIARALCR